MVKPVGTRRQWWNHLTKEREEAMSKMITYKVLYKNFKRKRVTLMGILIERRKDLRGKSLLESGLEWAKSMFGQTVKNKRAIFVVPHELNVKKESCSASEEDEASSTSCSIP
jgi:hypothetical protein